MSRFRTVLVMGVNGYQWCQYGDQWFSPVTNGCCWVLMFQWFSIQQCLKITSKWAAFLMDINGIYHQENDWGYWGLSQMKRSSQIIPDLDFTNRNIRRFPIHGGTPQSSAILVGFSTINYKPSSYWGYRIFQETPNHRKSRKTCVLKPRDVGVVNFETSHVLAVLALQGFQLVSYIYLSDSMEHPPKSG